MNCSLRFFLTSLEEITAQITQSLLSKPFLSIKEKEILYTVMTILSFHPHRCLYLFLLCYFFITSLLISTYKTNKIFRLLFENLFLHYLYGESPNFNPWRTVFSKRKEKIYSLLFSISIFSSFCSVIFLFAFQCKTLN